MSTFKPAWVTVSFIPGQQDHVAVWVGLDVTTDRPYLIRHQVAGVVLRHKVDQNDGIPSDSRTQLAVVAGADVIAVPDMYSGHGAVEFYGTFVAPDSVADQGAEIELVALRIRERMAKPAVAHGLRGVA